MGEYDEDLVATFIEECRDHLSSIEEDLVELERQGPDRDDDLVNRIFRAAHSIKGGAGFFDFTVIKELAHSLESVLDLVRTRKAEPEPELITILLRGFDRLSRLLDEPAGSELADVSDELVALQGLASSYLPGTKAEHASLRYPAPGASRELEAEVAAVDSCLHRGLSLCLLRFDLIHDVQRLGKTPLDILALLTAKGEILDCFLDLPSVGRLEDEDIADQLPFFVLYATLLSVVEAARVLEIPRAGITVLRLPTSSPEIAPQGSAAVSPPPEREPPRAERPEGPRAAAPTPPLRPPVAADTATPEPKPASEGQPRTQMEAETVRVSVSVLDDLMDLAGELVLARNELADAVRRSSATALQSSVQRVGAVTAGIQDAVMRSRMQPAANLFGRYQRTVRDLARDLGKDIELVMTGRDAELDRSLLETLSDPLTHLVRNACDHGIELPEQRKARGKSPRGKISLAARHEAGQVVVEVADDGKGIDAEAVAAKAVAMGLVPAERAARMSDKEKVALVTLPGLSTAAALSDLSGRGVGMDVVKSNVDRLGGRIDIESSRGLGTRVRITLPLTLSVMPALLAGIGGERFALPQAAVAELIHLRVGEVQRRVERVGDRSVLVLRGEVIPLVRLADVLGIERYFEHPVTGEFLDDRRENVADRRSPPSGPGGLPRAEAPETTVPRSTEDRRIKASSDYRIVVVRASGFRYGLIVDSLYDTTEIVVKPLGRHLKSRREYSGATILGDGAVSLILDPVGLALLAGIVSAGSDEAFGIEEGEGLEDTGGWLLFNNSAREQCAMPLESVERVVLCFPADFDELGGSLYLRRDDASLPVFSLAEFTSLAALSPAEAKACVLVRAAGRRFGFLALPPVDSVAAEALLDETSLRRPGVAGTAVIRGRTTVVIEPEGALRFLRPEWFENSAGSGREPERSVAGREGAVPSDAPDRGAAREGPLILLAEDSDFFRSLVTSLLEEEGYRVLAAPDGAAALALFRERRDEIAAVVSDVEMPVLDGAGLALALAAEAPGLPFLALTSLASAEDEERLRAAGASDYLVKLDREALLASLSRFVQRA